MRGRAGGGPCQCTWLLGSLLLFGVVPFCIPGSQPWEKTKYGTTTTTKLSFHFIMWHARENMQSKESCRRHNMTYFSYRGHSISWRVRLSSWAPMSWCSPPHLLCPGSSPADLEVVLLLVCSSLSSVWVQVRILQLLADTRCCGVWAVLWVWWVWNCTRGGGGCSGVVRTDWEVDHMRRGLWRWGW